jgi:hypothetical protein
VVDIFYYLGQVVDCELYHCTDAEFPPKVGSGSRRESLFSVLPGPGGLDAITVSFQGSAYHVPINEGSRSGEVLQIMSELLSLYSSAKSLPAPNVISVISR